MERRKDEQRRPGTVLFGALFALVYAVALAPPVYITLSRQHGMLLSIPASVWYMLLVSAAAIAVTYGLWLLERRRGVLD
ncbi:high-affinity Fe2+/Pb2+ permease [Amycolatopsis bartoniae]|uniref:DUF3311 domain-containing protein n=1 Tax=Amycolatopsis bartoniae TaxID=941986 RepID=A0A8H9IZP3_9PSEU|nr:hypothetical protein [Amycolatopsis bartoniae]MBB2939366.1 high-affinity Fe2+/Pb2+ permease [Amycolatopsis bartoniae]TVT06711.1 hypothetical protein FNH07_19075 [Amycolatopsis bartoniae]GHF83554.1 hypothetical protein GCM10017566_67020 [Amycolatopsis bartoniae]